MKPLLIDGDIQLCLSINDMHDARRILYMSLLTPILGAIADDVKYVCSL